MSTPEPHNTPPAGQLLIYQDGATRLQVRLDGQTVWLTQAAMAELYQTTPQNITLHLQSIYDDGELRARQLVRNTYKFALEGNRQVQRSLEALQPRRHSRRRLPRPLAARHALSPMGDGSAERTARQGLHARRRADQGRPHASGPTTSTNCSPAFATSAPASGCSIRRSPTSTPPASTTTPTPR